MFGVSVGFFEIENNHETPFVPKTAREFVQRRLLKTLPCCAFNQASPSRLHNQNTALDVRSILQSAAIRLFTDSNVVLHIRHYWNAGKPLRSTLAFPHNSQMNLFQFYFHFWVRFNSFCLIEEENKTSSFLSSITFNQLQ